MGRYFQMSCTARSKVETRCCGMFVISQALQNMCCWEIGLVIDRIVYCEVRVEPVQPFWDVWVTAPTRLLALTSKVYKSTAELRCVIGKLNWVFTYLVIKSWWQWQFDMAWRYLGKLNCLFVVKFEVIVWEHSRPPQHGVRSTTRNCYNVQSLTMMSCQSLSGKY